MDNVVKKESLVVIRDGVDLPNVETTEFERNKVYRAIELHSDNDSEMLVNGVAFHNTHFYKYFKYYDS